ncbi:HlyD family secretion protein [Pseudoxanthomonas suwonensis]|uniref:HlyD family secretion protein n=1 Tax=Pseudoxanthomonas suwonensis TaxID=314722 RepID=UPI0004913E4E|nr:HlyD family efflux transporter periplasmic adaptor subunit [Pseudoxanthomonas suwonensis]
MSDGLFRREALDARRSSWLGGIQLAQPLRLWLLTLGAALAASAVVAFLVLGSYTRRSTVTGQLVPTRGLSTIVAPAGGVVGRVDVQEGDRVRAGQRLAVVTVPRATLGNGDTLAALEERLQRRQEGLVASKAAQLQQLRVQEVGLRSQLATARRELAEVEAGIATRREQVRIAHETLDRLRQLEDVRYVSLLQIKQQESVALAQVGEMQVLERQATATRRLIAQLEQALAELPAQRGSTDAGYEGELAALEQEQVETRARGELVLTAAVDGIVTALLAKPGQAVQAGQPLLSVLPGDGVLEAELLVPSRAIGFIEPGDRVMLRYQAYPYQKFGHQQGRVERISRSALGPGELGNVQAAEPYYRVTVALARQAVVAYGREEPLRPGMLLDADILGERRRLVEWLLEPLYSLKGVG